MLRSVLLLLTLLLTVPASAATLHVGPGGDFRTVSAAVKASSANDTILIDKGTYTDEAFAVRHPLTIRGLGGKARLHAARPIPNGKAIIVANASLSIQNLIFSNAHVRDQNGAGIRHQRGALVILDSIFESNENGILGGSDPYATITIQNSHFVGNGFGDGYTHGIYIGKIASLVVKNSWFANTKTGHHIKSRARTTLVSECLLDDGDESSSYAIDLPNGGTNLVERNTFIQNAAPDNDIFISVGTKPVHESSSLTVDSNQFLNFAAKGTAVRNAMAEPVLISNNSFFGPLAISKGPARKEDNVVFRGVPETIDTFESWQESANDRQEATFP